MRVICLTMVPGGGAVTTGLRRLGYTPYTLRSVFLQGRATRHPAVWTAAMQGDEAADLRKLMCDFDSVAGPPATALYSKLLRDCPNYTKVILVEEPNKQEWARSYDKCITPLLQSPARRGRNHVSKAFYTLIRKMIPHQENLAELPDEAERVAGRVAAVEQYEAEVRRSVPAGRLLVFRHSDGWGPLCEFLGKTVPGEPFPPYDDGLHIIRNIHERVERTERITFLLLFVFGWGVLYAFYPVVVAVKKYFSQMYRDYLTVYRSE
uniref:Transmembrane protein n=1 Tax=Trypanosoma congolense (strain IL3000) TaxID=1068625 RepID=G0URB4_TRYCI|nr:conserved hypothetical protein [Trypanosoma congolense IL3000]